MGWIKIIETNDRFKGELIAAKLRESNIVCQLIDKKDSMYVMLGQVELYVQPEDVEQAKQIISTFGEEEE